MPKDSLATGVRGALKIEMLPLGSIKESAYNPRRISPEAFRALCRSIREFGFVDAILIQRSSMEIIGGHQRFRAARRLGLETIPAVLLDIDDNKARALNLALNKIQGAWDNDKLASMLEGMEVDLARPGGFSLPEIEDLKFADTSIEEVEVREAPKIVWYLIGVPIAEFDRAQKHIAALEEMAETSVQSSRDK